MPEKNTPRRKLPAGLAIVQVVALLTLLGLAWWTVAQTDRSQISYTELKEMIAAEQVDEVLFDGDRVRAKLIAEGGEVDGEEQAIVESVIVPGDEGLVPLLEAHGVQYSATPQSGCAEDGGGLILSMLVFAGIWMLFLRGRAGGGPGAAATFGRSSAKLAPEEGTGVSFGDIAGIDEAKEELQEVVQFLQTPERFTALGGKIPKGVLLVGPPGTGKTLLARAVAGEAGVPFFSISGSDFVEMFVGVGAARVRDLFEKARKHAPCIIFIDEIDAIGKSRGGGGPVGGNDEREQTLNQLLVEMDGFDGKQGIILMAATNRPETLDRALLRAGRFDRQVLVDRPDLKGRLAILQVHARTIVLADEVDLEAIARMTPGMTGADLANLLNEGALLAARADKKAVELADLREAIERVVAGLEKKSRRLSDEEKRIVAYHEAGHAVCAAASPGADPVQKISIIPRGIAALGYTLQLPEEDRYLNGRGELHDRLVVLYGGRAAEEVVLGDFTTGASNDLERATELARNMVTRFGMSDALGAVTYEAARQSPYGLPGAGGGGLLSQATAELIDREVRGMLEQAHERARAVIRANMRLVHEMATFLMEQEVIEGDDLKAMLARTVRLEGAPGQANAAG